MKRFLVRNLLLVMFIMFLFGCKSEKTQQVNETDNATSAVQSPKIVEAIPEPGTLDGDTINMHGKFVLFYGPKEESMNEKSEDISEIIEFRKISNEIIDSLSGNPSLFTIYTSVNAIRVYNKTSGKPMIILRSSFGEPVGMIISDGSQAPMIKKGSATKDAYVALINRMFGQPNS